MGRKREPRWYPRRGGWYVWVRGKLHRLAVGKGSKEEAWKQYHRLMLEEEPNRRKEPVSFSVLADLLLDWVKGHRGELTFTWYLRHLCSAARSFGDVMAHEIRPAHVHRWLDRSGWGRSTQHGAITAVKRATRWGVRQGLIDSDPLDGLEKPGIARRRLIPTPDQARMFLDSVDGPFRDLLFLLHETGMRPSEAYRVEASHVDWARSHVVFADHKTSSVDGRPRVIYLTTAAMDLLRRLAQAHPEGPLLRNKRGAPWTRHAVAHRFARLRKRLGMGGEATADALRHLFVTDCLDKGVPIATVAELAGHKSTAMVERHYGHLHERHAHLLDAVSRVRGITSSSDASGLHSEKDPEEGSEANSDTT